MRHLATLVAGLLVAPLPGVERDPAPTGRTHTVEIRNFAYHPERLEVSPGDTVVWINRDAAPHTATDSQGRWDSGEVGPGGRWIWVAGRVGIFSYRCAYHPSMAGTVDVRVAAGRTEGAGLDPATRVERPHE